MRPRPSPRRADLGEAGVTTVELTVVTIILAIAVAALFTTIVQMTTATAYAQARGETLDDVRLAIDTFTKDARQGAAVEAATASSLTLDTYIDATLTEVTWRVVEGGAVDRFERVVGGVVTASYDLALPSTSVFEYFGATDPAAVTRVRVRLASTPDAQTGDDTALEAEVDLRNVG